MAKHFSPDTGGTLTTGLLAYWKMDSADDYYGSFTLTNTDTTQDTAGKVGNCSVFNGSSSKLDFTDTGLPSGSNARSVSFWFNPSLLSASKNYSLFRYGTNTNYLRFFVNINTYTANGIAVDIYNEEKKHTVTLNTGTWYHCVVTLSGTAYQTFINGSSIGSGNFSNTPNTTLSSATMGFDAVSNYHNGLMDEVGIWSKVLNSTEIADLYNGGNGQTMTDVQALTLAMGTGALTLTGQAVGISRQFRALVMETGSFILSGISATLRFVGWTYGAQHTASWSENLANSASWTDNAQHSSSWTDSPEH
jgi:hypothetical protein